jgi:hypothetical protein
VKSESFDVFCRACIDVLEARRIRYLVVGGIAVTAVCDLAEDHAILDRWRKLAER